MTIQDMRQVIAYVQGQPVFEARSTAHDPSNGQFTSSGGGSGGISHHYGSDKHDVHTTIRHVFGKDVSPAELAKAVGVHSGKITLSTHDVHDDSGQRKVVAITVEHPHYTSSRYFFKDGDKKVCYNNRLDVKEQGKGIGSTLLHEQTKGLRDLGFHEIRTNASGGTDNGYYTWPRLGFDAELSAYKSRRCGGAKRVSDLMKTEEGRKLWKKEGGTTLMSFDLAADSLSTRVLDEYMKRKHG